MATTAVIPGCFYICTISGTSINVDTITHNPKGAVEIFSAKIELDLTNPIGVIPISISGGNVGEKVPMSLIMDLKRIKKTINVQGVLADDAAESGTAKRDNIISIMENTKGFMVLWGPSGNYRTIFGNVGDIKVYFDKMKFTETSGNYGEAVTGDAQPFRKIDVQLQFTIGKGVTE